MQHEHEPSRYIYKTLLSFLWSPPSSMPLDHIHSDKTVQSKRLNWLQKKDLTKSVIFCLTLIDEH